MVRLQRTAFRDARARLPDVANRVRLDRLLSSRGYCTRSQAPGFLRRHEVSEAGKPIERTDDKVDPTAVTIDGEPLDPESVLVALNKPVGYVCSHRDDGKLVYELLPERWPRRNPAVTTVGRLDKDTSGLLLLTDDGQIVHQLTSPKKHVPRVYVATLDRDLRGDEAEAFASGRMMLEGEIKPLLPAELMAIDARTARVTLQEGRYHQVRRMFAAVGNHVTALRRESFGGLTLDGLVEGAWRFVAMNDVVPPTP